MGDCDTNKRLFLAYRAGLGVRKTSPLPLIFCIGADCGASEKKTVNLPSAVVGGSRKMLDADLADIGKAGVDEISDVAGAHGPVAPMQLSST